LAQLFQGNSVLEREAPRWGNHRGFGRAVRPCTIATVHLGSLQRGLRPRRVDPRCASGTGAWRRLRHGRRCRHRAYVSGSTCAGLGGRSGRSTRLRPGFLPAIGRAVLGDASQRKDASRRPPLPRRLVAPVSDCGIFRGLHEEAPRDGRRVRRHPGPLQRLGDPR
jgi:hypothetical protein